MGRLLAGKYELLREIAVGGMAQVYLARQTGLSGFEKLVCIKRILPDRAADPDFRAMFLDEARLAADLRHPNIVDLYEIGEDEDDGERTLYIAMEYVHGQSLRFLQETASARRRGIPMSLSVQICVETARALHYAHTKKDLRGRPLGIVHRDVSPQNVLVGYEGGIKLCDFGVAKAAGRRTQTVVGMVKGKVSYMSPEQALGWPLDARSDLFSLGVILYELTTGMRLFPNAPGRDAMQEIARANVIAPSKVSASYPPALEAVVMKLLARERDERYPTAAAAAAAMEDWLASEGKTISVDRMGALMGEVFQENERELFPLHPREMPTAPVPPSGAADTTTGDEPTGNFAAPGISPPGGTPSAGTPSPSGAARRSNLPAETGAFIGRATDLGMLKELFERGERLVTLLGPGGAGKTRLALRYATSVLEQHAPPAGGGTWMVELSGARSADDVLAAVGGALGIPLPSGRTADDAAHLGSVLASRGRMLIVLDNFERVVDAAPETVGRWLAAAPELRLLVTSRERLKIAGERPHELGPLSLPSSGAPLRDSEAVQLFLACAKAARPDYEYSEQDARAVEHIVRTLDGLPLAIELAASRMKVFSPARLLERLPQRFEILSANRRDVTDRQATLRGAIDWSWSMLAPFEQAALAQASVFRGGFGLEAAEAVLDLSAWPGVAWVPDVIQSLRDKSLLHARPPVETGELRFGLYQSIRDYAAEKLAATPGGMEQATLLRHGEYFARAGAAWADAVDLHGGRDRLRSLVAEAENLLVVHRRASRGASPAAAALGARAVLALEPVFATRGPFGACERLANEALDYTQAQPLDETLRVRLLLARAWMRRMQSEAGAARVDADAARALAERLGERALEGKASRMVGLVAWDDGRYEESRLEYRRALELHRAAADRPMEARTIGDLANFDQEDGRLSDAQEKFEEAIAIAREVGDRRSEGIFLGYLGALLQERERRDAARAMYERAIAIQREFRDRRHEAMFVGYQGTLFHERGELDAARRNYELAIRYARDLGDRRQEGFYSSFLGALESAQARIEEAEAALAIAEDRLASDKLLSTMAALNRGHLELARAARSARPDALARARRALEGRIAEVESPGSAGATGIEAGRSLAAASMDVRLALRLLRPALAATASRASAPS